MEGGREGGRVEGAPRMSGWGLRMAHRSLQAMDDRDLAPWPHLGHLWLGELHGVGHVSAAQRREEQGGDESGMYQGARSPVSP